MKTKQKQKDFINNLLKLYKKFSEMSQFPSLKGIFQNMNEKVADTSMMYDQRAEKFHYCKKSRHFST